MLTLLIYIVVIAVVAAVLFFVASAAFGRGEELEPLPEGTTATVLPAENITGADVDALQFQQAVRGYKQREVDWALERLGAEIDMLRSRLAAQPESRHVAQPESRHVAQSDLQSDLQPSPSGRHSRPRSASPHPESQPESRSSGEPGPQAGTGTDTR